MSKVKYYYDPDTLSYRKIELKKSVLIRNILLFFTPYFIGLFYIGQEVFKQGDYYLYKKDIINVVEEREIIYQKTDSVFQDKHRKTLNTIKLAMATFEIKLNKKEQELALIDNEIENAYSTYDSVVDNFFNLKKKISNRDSLLVEAIKTGEEIKRLKKKNEELRLAVKESESLTKKEEVIIKKFLNVDNEQDSERRKKEKVDSFWLGFIASLCVALIGVVVTETIRYIRRKRLREKKIKEEKISFPFMMFCDLEEQSFFIWNNLDLWEISGENDIDLSILNNDILKIAYETKERKFSVGKYWFIIKARI